MQQAAELAAVVAAAVAQEVGTAALAAREGGIAGVDEVAHVDECEALRTIAHGEVDVLANAVGHEEIVALARAVDAGGAQDDVVQTLHAGEGFFGFEFRAAVVGVGHRAVVVTDGAIGCSGSCGRIGIGSGSHDRERGHEDEATAQQVQLEERARQAQRARRVGAAKGFEVGGLGGTGGVNHAVESTVFGTVRRELTAQFGIVAEIQLDEANAGVGEITARTRGAESRPHFVAVFQTVLDEKRTDETGGTGDEDFHKAAGLSVRPVSRANECFAKLGILRLSAKSKRGQIKAAKSREKNTGGFER